jgi:hypothetical protein
MVLAEVLTEKRNLRQKISQLEDYLHRTASQDAEVADKATIKLLNLLDKYRSHLILINEINNSIKVSIGSSKVSLANAIIITKTMRCKIDLLNSLIEQDSVLDVFSLMEQRDKLFDEYTTISNGLSAIEWSTDVD